MLEDCSSTELAKLYLGKNGSKSKFVLGVDLAVLGVL